jgi:hypothetical protein
VLELTPSNITNYLISNHRISVHNPTIESLSGGVSALVFKITTPDQTFILKQACKQLRVKDLWLSDPARIEREFLFLYAFKSLAQNSYLTEPLWHDNQNHVLAMSLAPAPATAWKTDLLGQIADPVRAIQAADLLAAIDFDRCMVYDLYTRNENINDAYDNAVKLFEVRVFRHSEDNLYITEYSKNQDKILKQQAIQRINSWNRIINCKSFI